jgi:FG-GAP-like repeat
MFAPRRLVAVMLLSLCPLGSWAAPTVGFTQAQQYPVGTAPRRAAIGDFNGDHTSDLAVCNFGDPATSQAGNVSILLGKGDGSFAAAVNFIAVNNCTGIVAGDFDGDSKSDLLVLRTGDASAGDAGDATIFLSNGDGTFRKGQTLVPGQNPADAVVSDVNADHKLDLIFGNSTDKTVSVLLGNGDGSFQSQVVYSVGGSPSSVQLVDINQDGKSDVAVLRFQGVDFLLGNGDGSFRQASSFSLGFSLSNPLAIADFNGDGTLDLIVRACSIFQHPNGCGTTVSLGNGSGGFQSATVISDIPGATPADVNGDGALDLVGATPDASQVAVVLGNGDGTFQSSLNFPAGTSPAIGAIADLNGDTAPDLIALNPSSNSVSVVLNTGTDFSISASAPSSSNLSPGQSATSAIILTLLTAFNNPVSLACSVQPMQAGSPSCSLNSNPVRFDSSGKATTTLTITSASLSAALVKSRAAPSGSHSRAFVFLAIVGLVCGGIRLGGNHSPKSRVLLCVMGTVMASGLISQIACGGSNSKAPVSYAVQVTGTSVVTQHSTTVTISVQ